MKCRLLKRSFSFRGNSSLKGAPYIRGITLAFLLFGLPAFCEGWEPDKPKTEKEMTLADCVFLALRNNRSIKSAYLDRVVQKFDLKVAEDEFYPDVTIDPSIEYTSTGDGDIRTHTKSGGISATVTEKIKTGGVFTFTWENSADIHNDNNTDEDSYISSWNLAFEQPLLRGGGIDVNTASLVTARISEKLHILSLKSTIMETITSAISAYRSLLQARKGLEISRKSLKTSKELLEVNKALIEAGRMARVEIVQTQSDVANKEFSLAEAENVLDAARLNLLKVLDIDKHTMIVPVEKIETYITNPDLSQCQTLAFENRPDYLGSLLNMKITELDLILAENNRLWDLSFEAAYGIGGQDENHMREAFKRAWHANRSEWNLGLRLSIPLYGDLTRKQYLLTAKTGLKKAELDLKELKANIEIGVLDAIRDVELKLKQVELARQARELSKKKLEVEKEKLRAGRSSNFQIVTFQNDLAKAQYNELNAMINYMNAQTSLDKTLGTTLATWKVEIKED